MNKPYIHLATPSNGYLIVPVTHVTEAILKGAKISKHSRIVGKEVYLDRYHDVPQFNRAMNVTQSQIIKRHGEFDPDKYPSFMEVVGKQAQS